MPGLTHRKIFREMTKILLVDDDVELINMIKEQLFILNSYCRKRRDDKNHAIDARLSKYSVRTTTKRKIPRRYRLLPKSLLHLYSATSRRALFTAIDFIILHDS
jgi:CheY-like chemotaxis protein